MSGIKPWLFEFFHAVHDPARRDDPVAHAERFAWYLDRWDRMEGAGWEGLMFSEHHFGPAFSPSPNLLVATMAQRTTTLRLGVLGNVSPYSTPWRVAEEFAMLDQLSKGRIEVGVVSGIPPEVAVIGMGPAEAVARHHEIMDVLEQALRRQPVTLHGTYWNFDGLRLVPGFVQDPPPVWTAATNPASMELSARRGWKLCSGFLETSVMAKYVADSYFAVGREAGQDLGPDHVAVRRVVSFSETEAGRDEAVARAAQHLKEVIAASAKGLGPAALPDAPVSNLIHTDEFVAGTPAQVAEQIIEQCRTVGAGHFMAAFAGVEPAEIGPAHDLFTSQVLPVLRRA